MPKKRWLLEFTSSNPSAGSSAGGGGGGGGGGGDGAAAPALEAEKATPEKKSARFKLPDDPSAGSSAGGGVGGGGGDGAAAPRPAPQQEPSSSRPPSLPPPDDDDGDEDDEDDDDIYDFEGFFKEEELDRLERESGYLSLYMSDPAILYMDSKDPQKPPEYIGRQSCEPLVTQEFFLLRGNWQQLLDGKKTYLRPPKNNRVAKHSDDHAFVTPEPLEKAVRCQEPLSDIVREAGENSIIQQKFKILSEHYVCIRQMRIDGSSFYRAFLYSYLENLGKMQGSQAEVTRLMECVARSRENFCCLHWDRAYFSNPEAFFSTVVSEFENLVSSVANGLNADELYKRSLQEITSSRILCLLRLLTEVHIRTHHADYDPAFREQTQALKFCIASVRPFDALADALQMSALSNALGIPLHVVLMNNDGSAEVKCFDFLPQPESRVSKTSIKIYDLSSATDKHPEQGRDDSNSTMPAGNLFLSDQMPLVTLLGRMGHCDILYRN